MTTSPPSSLPLLLIQSQRALSMSQTQLGQLLGVSKRTIQRWQDRETTLLPSTFRTLAAAVYPKDPALAARIAAHGSTTLEALAPRAIRPALAAALVRARQVGLDVDALIEALTGSAGGAARVARRGRRR